MGGHGVHTTPNMNNFKQSDEEMQGQIQTIETIKYNPQMFHVDIKDPSQVIPVIGGTPTIACTAVGGLLGYGYYAVQSRSWNMYSHVRRVQNRVFLGMMLGAAFGYQKFGDRQRVHNGFVAERLRSRYPESMNLHETDLWRFKGVTAPHDFYKWA